MHSAFKKDYFTDNPYVNMNPGIYDQKTKKYLSKSEIKKLRMFHTKNIEHEKSYICARYTQIYWKSLYQLGRQRFEKKKTKLKSTKNMPSKIRANKVYENTKKRKQNGKYFPLSTVHIKYLFFFSLAIFVFVLQYFLYVCHKRNVRLAKKRKFWCY